jgi:peptidoglycan/LPS O-acetylase OafA/YrhL
VPALDGLRALAVVAVMLYHGGVSWMPGGFLGVDLFFVLSGYLITTLLVAERARWGSIDLLAFWARRGRRLLPALFLMLIAVAIYAATLAPTNQQATIRGEGLATLLYVSNWWAIVHGHSYFDQFLQPSPLTHTWSLAIEEQWYLLFPVVLSILLVRRTVPRWLTWLLAGGAVASAAWMAHLFHPGTDPSRAYFGTDSRIQDLFVGAALAVWLRRREPRAPGSYRLLAYDRWVPAAALGVVLAAMCLLHEEDARLYRGGFLVFCGLCAVVIAHCLDHKQSRMARALSWEPIRLVGLISYGLYLWHWPVDVVLSPARTGLDGPALLGLRSGVAAAAAAASYVLVERPVRRGRLVNWLGRRGELYVAIAAAILVAAALVIATPTKSSGFAADGSGSSSGVSGAGLKVFFVGDSVSYNLRYYFDPAKTPGISLDGSTKLGCGLIPKTNVIAGKPDPPAPGCAEWAAGWPAELAAGHRDLSVLFLGIGEQFDVQQAGGNISFGTPAYARFLDKYLDGALATMAKSSDHVAIMNVPCHRVLESDVNPIPTIVNDQRRIDWLNQYLLAYQKRSSTPFSVIDLNKFICVDGDPVQRGDVKLRFDGLHFTAEGAALVWKWLGPQLVSIAGRTKS